MTETKKTYTQPAMTKKKVIVSGLVKFSTLGTPKAMTLANGTVLDPSYEVTITFEEGSDTQLLLETLHHEAVAAEKALLPASKQKTGVRELRIDVDTDKEGNTTGLLRMTFRRKERNKPAPVVIKEGQVTQMEFIRAGSEVQVQLQAQSYIAGGMIGLALTLEAVNIVTEAAMPENYVAKPKGIDVAFDITALDNPFQ